MTPELYRLGLRYDAQLQLERDYLSDLKMLVDEEQTDTEEFRTGVRCLKELEAETERISNAITYELEQECRRDRLTFLRRLRRERHLDFK